MIVPRIIQSRFRKISMRLLQHSFLAFCSLSTLSANVLPKESHHSVLTASELKYEQVPSHLQLEKVIIIHRYVALFHIGYNFIWILLWFNVNVCIKAWWSSSNISYFESEVSGEWSHYKQVAKCFTVGTNTEAHATSSENDDRHQFSRNSDFNLHIISK